jgi:DNA-binding response OmpR family regulator
LSIPEHQPRKKALLVEDEALVAMVASEILQELGFEVIDAATAEAARQHTKASVHEFEFALIDLGLPDQPGEMLIESLRALRPELPIIISSGRGSNGLRKRYPPEQGFALLDKPYDYAALELAIQAIRRL